jgi:putative DNA primase/helicase
VNVAEAAGVWQAAGVSVIPIMANQTKRPAVQWSPYIAAAPTLDNVHEWWGNGKPWGLALICGAVSGNLEMTELEGRATSGEQLTEIQNRMDEAGVGHVWDLLTGPDGYSEMSPSGGIHLLYRIRDHEVPGNTKIAANEEGLVLAETRGHGGYVICAPTTGVCHPSGEPWVIVQGNYGILPVITWEERNGLHEALALALDQRPDPPSRSLSVPPPPSPTNLPVLAPSGLLSPADHWEQNTDWNDILGPHGWQLESRGPGNERTWTRPGKDRRDGMSATTGRANDRDRFYCFSTSTIFEAEVPYTKFGVFTLLNFNGDHHAAAQELVRRGFGERPVYATPDDFIAGTVLEETVFTHDDSGNGMYLADRLKDKYRYVSEEKRWYRWAQQRWVYDYNDQIVTEVVRMTDDMMAAGEQTGNDALLKWAKRTRSRERITAAITISKAFGVTHSSSEWNPHRHLLNVHNGVLNLNTGKLSDHDPALLITHMFGTEYDETAACPQFENFMERAIPDAGMRRYVQRALGQTLTGDADQRSLFLIYGPSGTGKSTLMECMRDMFGTYGTTAQSGTFRAPKGEKGPSNDLHELRGLRFVTTSETAEGTAFDEDLLKRLTGRDRVRSRALYQESVEWVPECTIWVATNNPPKFSSDDDAIWRRTKLIPFSTVFRGDGEVYDFARKILAAEGAGILNWLLAGLRDFQEHGLGEPEAVKELAQEQRAESDSVARFLGDELADGLLVLGEDQTLRCSELFARYIEWTKRNSERPVGNRRFNNRLTSHFSTIDRIKTDGHLCWSGIGRSPGVSILGSI